MNKLPLTKKQIIEFFKKQKSIIVKSELVDLQNSHGRFLFEDLKAKLIYHHLIILLLMVSHY